VGKKWLEIGYNPKDLWSVTRIHAEDPERENHPTQKPLEIIERIIKASCPEQGVVLDPFMGSGTTAVACIKLNRNYIGFEINPDYCKMIEKRIKKVTSNPSLFSMPRENNLHKKSDIDEQKNLFEVEQVKKTARHSV